MAALASSFSAGPQAGGYLYQVRFALLTCLQLTEEKDIVLEHLDDVHYEQDGKPSDLLQFKYHVASLASLTDRSSDLWKSLRVWSFRVANGEIDLKRIQLKLITNAVAQEGSIAAQLRAGVKDRRACLSALIDVARTGGSKENAASYEAFLSLSDDQRASLVDTIVVLDGAPGLLDLGAAMERELRLVALPQHLQLLREQLEGWWIEVASGALVSSPPRPIPFAAIRHKINDLRDQLGPLSLPDEFSNANLPEGFEANSAQAIYLRQLAIINAKSDVLQRALLDFFRASQQRSSWVRQELVGLDELPKYDQLLHDEWEVKRSCLDDPRLHDEELQRVTWGRKLYNWVQTDFSDHLRIRPGWVHPYMLRGSYHMLADQLDIGWHPDYDKILPGKKSRRSA